jgi:hypothetical protein
MAKVKSKLKGKNAARLKKEDKAIKEKTLKRMDKIRNDDSIRLRHKIQEQLSKHKAEVLKADNFIKEQSQKIESIKVAKLRLEGAIISLQEILNNEIEPDTNN